MDSYKTLVNSIKLTPDYPKKDILFADLSPMFEHLEALRTLITIWGKNLGADADCVVVGIPTRGNIWATTVASTLGLKLVNLSKHKTQDGNYIPHSRAGTPLPEDAFLFSSSTVYTNQGEESVFTLSKSGRDTLLKAGRVMIVDDVSESGKTMEAAQKAICALTGLPEKRVYPMPVLSIEGMSTLHMNSLICSNPKQPGIFYPGNGIKYRPELLGKLRGYPLEGAHHRVVFNLPETGLTVVYGLPSMYPHLVSYVSGRKDTIVGDLRLGTFPDGKPDVQFAEYKGVSKILWFYDGLTNEKTQDFIIHALARNSPTSVPMEVVIPYFADGTMERVDKDGTLATAQSALHSLCASMPRIVTVSVVDIHHTGTRFYTSDRVSYQDIPLARRLFDQYMEDYPPEQPVLLVFPDGGSHKRYGQLFPEFTKVICDKMRVGEEGRRIHIKEISGMEDPTMDKNKSHKYRAIILDDLIRSGGTILNVGKALRNSSFGERLVTVEAICVHSDFNPGATYRFLSGDTIDFFVTTNTCYDNAFRVKEIGGTKAHVYDFVRLWTSRKVGSCIESFNLFDTRGGFIALASASEEKLTGVMASHKQLVPGCWTFDVPNFSPEQPVGLLEGQQACQRRLDQLVALYDLEWIEKFAFESFAEDQSSGSGVIIRDRMVIMFCDEQGQLQSKVDGTFFPDPHLFADELKKPPQKRKVLGALLQDRYNLDNKSAWIERGKRVKQMIDGVRTLGPVE